MPKSTYQELLDEINSKTIQLSMCGVVAYGMARPPYIPKDHPAWSESYECVKALRERWEDLMERHPEEMKRESVNECDPIPAWWK